MRSKNKVAIVGAAGMLGSALSKVFPDALFLDSNTNRQDVQMVDITDVNYLMTRLKGFSSGDLVINAAAYTDVDGAETVEGKILSERVNVLGARNLAKTSHYLGFGLVHYSTAYVFDGDEKGMYCETDKEGPKNNYGLHKFTGERFVLEAGGVVLRTDCLFGPSGSDFVDTIRQIASSKRCIDVVNDQLGSPTYTKDLALATRDLIDHLDYISGVYHAVNSWKISRADLAAKVIEILDLNCVVKEVSTIDYNKNYRTGKETAVRPKDCSLNSYKLRNIGIKLREGETALRDYLTNSR